MSDLLEEAKRHREAHDRALACIDEWLPKLSERLRTVDLAANADSDEELRGLLMKDEQLDRCRKAYHQAVRELYESGMSVSEIVDTVGAPVRKVKEMTKTIPCSLCGRTMDMVGKLIAGPEFDICDRCVSLASAAVEGDTSNNQSPAFQRLQADDVRCSFCHEGADRVETIVEAEPLRICNECVSLCKEILEVEAPASQQR